MTTELMTADTEQTTVAGAGNMVRSLIRNKYLIIRDIPLRKYF